MMQCPTTVVMLEALALATIADHHNIPYRSGTHLSVLPNVDH